MLTRRRFLGSAAAAGLTGALATPSQASMPPLDGSGFPGLDQQQHMPWLGLATSLLEEHRYEPRVDGQLPSTLRGVLVRNGPGRFDRKGLRKRCVLDGDGMLQRYQIDAGRVTYENRYTRTRKFVDEERKNEYQYATWTTQAPGGALSNLFARSLGNQAGVSVWPRGDALIAFDESSKPHEIDAKTLDTRGPTTLGSLEENAVYAAHPKLCARTGEWLHFGLEYGRKINAHIHVFRADGQLDWHRKVELPRYVYMHDWFVSENHLILSLQPAEVDIFGFLIGRRSLAGSFRWRPEQGNLLMLLPRNASGEPRFIETEATWMWHSLNAFERGGEIIADFSGYDAPDDFIGDDPSLWAIMEGRRGRSSDATLRRYVIDPAAGSLRTEVLCEAGSVDFPTLAPTRRCVPHRYGYLACGSGDTPFWNEVARIDTFSGKLASHHFGSSAWCGEPIFAPHPDGGDGERERGWILTQVYDGTTRLSYLAVLDAEHLGDGPVARIHHTHHIPLSFHGNWLPA